MTGTATHKVILTTFTDPMMGLSYESEPVFRRLETHFGDSIEFRCCMSLLVRDVHDFMLPRELKMSKKEGVEAYCKRLAGIYEDEEAISGMPICMENFRLFDEEHTTSLPLDLAFKTIELIAPDKAEFFLYLLRYATIVDTRPTTHFDEIMKVVQSIGIDETEFEEKYRNGEAEEALNIDLSLTRKLNIYSLPAYLLQYGDRGILINALIGYHDFEKAIFELTEGKVLPQKPVASEAVIADFISKRNLICSVELREAFNIQDIEILDEILDHLINNGRIKRYPVKNEYFIIAV